MPPDALLWATGSIWNDMFVLGLPVAEKVIRPVLVYVALVIGLRVFGKRELAQLNPFDLVVLLSLSNTVQNAIIGEDNSVTGGLIGALALLTINYVVVRFLFRHHRLDQIVQGKPAVLIKNGKVNRKALARELITVADLLTILHRQGFSRIAEIDHCELEPGGGFAITPHEPLQPERHHSELLHRIDALRQQLSELHAKLDQR